MKQIVHKKNFGMYSISIDEDGSLQLQAPTLLKPITIEAPQSQELGRWLAEVYHISTPTTTMESPNLTILSSTTPATSEPPPANAETAPAETSESTAQNTIRGAIDTARSQYPATLAPENRDRFIEQLIRNPTLRSLLSEGKITRKQILLWVEQQLGTNLF